MTRRIRACGRVAAVFMVICALSSTARAAPFLSAEVNSALLAKDEFKQSVGLKGVDLQSFESWLETGERQQFDDRLAEAESAGTYGPWPNYMRGLLAEDGDEAAGYYGRAMEAAGPGELWLLALEFARYEQYAWADAAFQTIEKMIIAAGGTSAPFLSQMLMLAGNAAANSPERAAYYYKWARKFDPNQPWWAYKKGGIDFPNNVIGAAPGFISEAIGTLQGAWRAQVSFICGVYRYLSVTLFIFVCSILIVLAVKLLPSGTHALGDALFKGAAPRFRTASSVILVLSVLILGILPGLWLIAFMIYRFASPAEKKLIIFACAILAISPLDHYATNSLRYNLRPDSAATLLDRAISEGYSDGLHRLAQTGAAKRPDSYASQLALGISHAKKGDYPAAAEAVDKAIKLAPNDIMSLMYAGNIAFLEGDIEDMERYLNSLLAKYPKCAAAKYNIAQAYAGEGKLIASDMITDAAKVDAALIGNYMRENEHYFDGDPPPLRRVMQPVISPGYFWSNLAFPGLKDSFGAADTYSGLISPGLSFAISALAFVTLAALGALVWGGNRPRVGRAYFVCRICGRLLCRRCRKGTMCSDCYKACIDSHNNAATMYNLQKACQERANAVRSITKGVLGMFIPGADKLHRGETVFRPAAVILLSSAVYAAYYCALTFNTAYPSMTVIKPVYFVWVLLAYNIVAIVRQGTSLTSSLTTR